MDYKLSQELGNAVLEYLANRPYKEVVTLISELQKLPPLKEDTTVKKEESHA